MLITKSQFLRYQGIFFDKIKKTPHKIQLEIVSVAPREDTGEFSMDAFVGDSPRESKFYEFQALYETMESEWSRMKYGMPREVNGIVYLSPKQLVPKFGDYHLNRFATKVHFAGKTQVVEKICYLEEMYGSCIGVQIFVKDDENGG